MAAKGHKAICEYMYQDGTASSRLAAGTVVGVRFKFAHGKTEEINLGMFDEPVRVAAMWRGLQEKIRDTYAGSDTAEEAHEEALGMIEQLSLKGGWYAERKKGEPRVSDLVAALVAYSTEIGKPQSEADFKAKVQDETYRERAKAIPRVAEIMVDLRSARQKAAIAKAAAEPTTAAEFTL